MLYLADSSIWIAARGSAARDVREALARRLEDDEIAICVPIALEMLTGPETGRELDHDWETAWRHLNWLPVTDEMMERALDLQLTLAHTAPGAHRRRAVDYIVVACAEAAGDDVTLWHASPDIAAICEHARIPHEPDHCEAAV